MATQPTAKEEREHRETEKRAKSNLVIVELAKRRNTEQVRRLRKGRGPLASDIEDALEELVKSGTIKADATPVVVVVREVTPPLMWALDYDDDEPEDDDDEDDEDEDDDRK